MIRFKHEIRIDGIFESAHYLYDYLGPGKNEPLHGHTFEVEVFIGSNRLKNGISVDFLEIRKSLDELLITLDHTCLNAHKPFDELNPTAENLGEYFAEKLQDKLPENSRFTKITVWEGPKNNASYYPDSGA